MAKRTVQVAQLPFLLTRGDIAYTTAMTTTITATTTTAAQVPAATLWVTTTTTEWITGYSRRGREAIAIIDALLCAAKRAYA